MSFIPFLQTAGDGAAVSASGAMLQTFVPLVLIVLIMYFFLLRPQSKKQKETERMLNALKKGDKIVTIGGIHGVISSVKEKTVIVKVDDNTKLEFNRTAISTVEKSEAELAKEAEEKSAKKGKKDSEKAAEKAAAETNEEK